LLPPDPRDVRLTPKGDMSTDKAALHELALLDPRARRVRDYREALNLRSKFIGSLFKSAAYNDEHDRTHPEAILFGTYTGRMTYASSQGKGAK
jgi:DNA polymerase I-like protein with 3'-5' exonuclease and polymerase domains